MMFEGSSTMKIVAADVRLGREGDNVPVGTHAVSITAVPTHIPDAPTKEARIDEVSAASLSLLVLLLVSSHGILCRSAPKIQIAPQAMCTRTHSCRNYVSATVDSMLRVYSGKKRVNL